MTPENELEIVKRYLKGLEPDQLVALLMKVHGSVDGPVYLMILAAETCHAEAEARS